MKSLIAPVVRYCALKLGFRLAWPVRYTINHDGGDAFVQIWYAGVWFAREEDYQAAARRMVYAIRSIMPENFDLEEHHDCHQDPVD